MEVEKREWRRKGKKICSREEEEERMTQRRYKIKLGPFTLFE